MRVQIIHHVVCYGIVFCCCRDILVTTVAMVIQPQSKFPPQPVEFSSNQHPRNHAAALIRRQPLTRFNFIMMSCSSTLFSPLILSSDAVELEIIDESRISSGKREFVWGTKLGLERIGTIHTDMKSQSSNKLNFISMNNNEPLYYPTFMFGAWNVTANLKRVTRIQNSNVVSVDKATTTSSSASTQYFQRQYFTTIANTIQNQMTINLGTGIPETKVISNRAFNLPSELILLQKNIITHTLPISTNFINLTWDYRSSTAPTRVSWDDGMNQNIRYEYETVGYESELGSIHGVFAAMEQNRIRVFDKSSLRTTIETEVTTEYHETSAGVIAAFSRIMVKDSQTPKSVTVLDFELSMNRIVQSFTNDSNGNVTKRPCVETPKGIVQCY